MEVPEGEEREQGIKNLQENIMTKNFPNLVKEVNIQVQEVHTVSNKMKPKRPTPKQITLKMAMVKGNKRNLKAIRENLLYEYNRYIVNFLNLSLLLGKWKGIKT